MGGQRLLPAEVSGPSHVDSDRGAGVLMVGAGGSLRAPRSGPRGGGSGRGRALRSRRRRVQELGSVCHPLPAPGCYLPISTQGQEAPRWASSGNHIRTPAAAGARPSQLPPLPANSLRSAPAPLLLPLPVPAPHSRPRGPGRSSVHSQRRPQPTTCQPSLCLHSEGPGPPESSADLGGHLSARGTGGPGVPSDFPVLSPPPHHCASSPAAGGLPRRHPRVRGQEPDLRSPAGRDPGDPSWEGPQFPQL